MTEPNDTPVSPPGTQLPGVAHRWIPWISRLAIASLIALFVAVAVQKVFSADLWWQIRNGEWILENLRVPTQEMYSFTKVGTPLREMRWLFCLLVAGSWRIGEWMPTVVQAALVGLAWALVIWPWRRTLLSPVAIAAVSLGLIAGMARWVMRPELVTCTMFSAFLLLLEADRRARDHDGKRSRSIWLIPLLQVVWVNTHTTFLFGPILCGVFACANIAEVVLARFAPARAGVRFNWYLWIVLALTIAACWVNPYGHWGAMYAVQVYQETSEGHVTKSIITEMRSPLAIPIASWGWDFFAAAALIFVAAGVVGLHALRWWRRSAGPQAATLRGPGIARLVVVAVAAYLFVMLQRNTGLAAILAAWAVLTSLHDMRTACAPADSQRYRSVVVLALLSIVNLGTAWYIATDRYAISRDFPREFGLGIVRWYQPRGVSDFIRKNNPEGQMFNIVRDGSYFIESLAGTMPVYIDGRTDAYGPAHFGEFAALDSATFEEATSRWKINTAVLPTRGYEDIIAMLRANPAWALVHLDHASVVFLRRTAGNEPIIARSEMPRHAAWPTVDTSEERLPAWRTTLGGVTRPWRSLGIAEGLIALGEPQAAKPLLERVIEVQPSSERGRMMLAPLLEAEGRVEAATALLDGLSDEMVADARQNAASMLLASGNLKQAIEPLEVAVSLNPGDAALREVLADTYFRTEAFEKARNEFITVIGNGPGTVSQWNKLGGCCERLGDWPGVIRSLEQSLTLDPNQFGTWNVLGAAYGRTGNLDRAEACFNRSLSLQPEFDQAKRNLERVKQLRK